MSPRVHDGHRTGAPAGHWETAPAGRQRLPAPRLAAVLAVTAVVLLAGAALLGSGGGPGGPAPATGARESLPLRVEQLPAGGHGPGGQGPGGQGRGRASPGPAGPMAVADGSWLPIPAAPVADRDGHARAWTGAELLVWGGRALGSGSQPTTHFADGAAFDPAARSWRTIAAAPVQARVRPGSAWTGDGWVLWGGEGPERLLADGALYDPAQDRWTSLPRAPLSPRAAPAMVWTGAEVWVLGGQGAEGPLRDAAAYDPATGRWRRLPPLPATLADAPSGAAVRGDGIEVFLEAPGTSWARFRADEDGSGWSLQDAEERASLVLVDVVAVEGTLVRLVDDFGPGGPRAKVDVRERGGRRWRTIPVPAGSRVPSAYAVAAEDRVFVVRGGRAVYELSLPEGRVRRLQRRPGPERFERDAVWAGDRLLLWGGRDEAGGLLALEWLPAR